MKVSSRFQDSYSTIPFPKSRRFLVDIIALGARKHLIHGLLEVDVTEPRRRLRQQRAQTGDAPSFTGFVIGCVAKAVDENKIMHAYRGQGDQLVLFDDVDVTTLIEVEADGRRFPIGHIIRAANRRSLAEIHREIRDGQAGKGNESGAQPGGWRQSVLLALPSFLRQMIYKATVRKPGDMKKNVGTVLVTAVGMFGTGGGWGIPITMHTLSVTLGGIARKPVLVDGKLEEREHLSVTISLDHDIIDGAPAARFGQRLQELIENGYGLSGERPESR